MLPPVEDPCVTEGSDATEALGVLSFGRRGRSRDLAVVRSEDLDSDVAFARYCL